MWVRYSHLFCSWWQLLLPLPCLQLHQALHAQVLHSLPTRNATIPNQTKPCTLFILAMQPNPLRLHFDSDEAMDGSMEKVRSHKSKF